MTFAAPSAARLDWRFLLPDPDPASWIHLGPPDSVLAHTLGGLAAADGGRASGRSGLPCDLVVAEGSGVDLAQAFDLVRPGGWLYLEQARLGLGPKGRSPALGLARHLRQVGFADVSLTWPWPDHDRATRFMPLGAGAPRMALGRVGEAVGARLAASAARVLGSLDLLGLAVPAVSAIARRPGPDPREPLGLVGALVETKAEWGFEKLLAADRLDEVDWVLLTPRFRSSRHVVLLCGPQGDEAPTVVAKMARRPGDAAALCHTAMVLDDLRSDPGPHLAAVPRVLGQGQWAGRPVLATSAVPGRPLSPAVVRKQRERSTAKVVEWLLCLPRSQAGAAGDRLRSFVDPALEPLSPYLGLSVGLGETVARARQALGRTDLPAVPQVFEHGDLGHPNLLWTDQGDLGVVDWELGRPDGLPLHDLTFFLAYAAGAAARARTAADHVAAWQRAVLERDGWARPWLRTYVRRMGLPGQAVAPLVVASWARYLGSLPERAVEWSPTAAGASIDSARPDRTVEGGSASPAAWLAEHRFCGLLAASLAGWDSLAAVGHES